MAPLDVFLLVHLKPRAHATELQDVQDLQYKIFVEIATMTFQKLRNVRKEIYH